MIKKLFMILFIFLTALNVLGQDPQIKKGDTAMILVDWSRVTIKNPEGIRNSNYQFRFNDVCGIHSGGVLTIMAFINGKLMVAYEKKGDLGNSQCPSGTLFMISRAEYLRMTDRGKIFKATQLAEWEEKQEIREAAIKPGFSFKVVKKLKRGKAEIEIQGRAFDSVWKGVFRALMARKFQVKESDIQGGLIQAKKQPGIFYEDGDILTTWQFIIEQDGPRILIYFKVDLGTAAISASGPFKKFCANLKEILEKK